MKPSEDKKAYKLRIYDQNKKFLEVLRFGDINKLENFIGELIKNGYKIDNVEFITSHFYYDRSRQFNPASPDEGQSENIWFYNKKEKKYYLLFTDEKSDKKIKELFNFLIGLSPKEFSLFRKVGFSEYKKLPKIAKHTDKKLFKKREYFFNDLEKINKPKRDMYLEELAEIDKNIKKMEKKAPDKNRKHKNS